MSSRSGGQIVVDTLKAAGVDTVFGVLSVHNIPMYDAIDRDGGIRAVPARTEAGALNMADGYARATGRLGVAISSTGVGAANAAGPLVEAYVGSSPVLHLTGQVDSAHVSHDRGVLHQPKDQLGLLKSAGKDAFRALRTETIEPLLQEAIRCAFKGRPGPVSVEIPIDQQYRTIDAASRPFAAWRPEAPDSGLVGQAAELLRRAKRPLIWAGGGVISANASAELRQLADKLGAGALTTAGGRGSIPEDHPLCLGNFATDAALAEVLARSDLLLATGTRFRSNETRSWQLPLPPVIQIDAQAVGENYPIELGIVGDAKLTLGALLSLVDEVVSADNEMWRATIEEARLRARAALRETLGPYEQIMDDLRSAFPRDAIVARDVTVPATAWGARLLEIYEPRTEIHSAALATGQGLGMAIGACTGQPDKRVLLLAGDGGFAVSLGELGTAAQEKCKLIITLFDDGGYGILRTLEQAYFDGRRFAVDLHAPDWTRLGEAFGMWTAEVRRANDFRPALDQALIQPGPALLVVDQESVGPMAVPFTGVARLIPEQRA
ncbi:MAG TPA: thiamine pyrophosphate-binding protein [Chloroflexota bacterium]